MIKAAIIGGSSYAAGELLRVLLNHPDVEVVWVHSDTDEPKQISDVHQGLTGEDRGLRFTSDMDLAAADVVFLCMPNGWSRRWLAERGDTLPADLRIVDLSADHRMEDGSHDFVYGLPELNRKRIVRGARRVANPGAYAMAIEPALLPLAKAGLLPGRIHATAITGSTFEGSTPTTTTNYSWRGDNVALYNPFTHRHLAEVEQAVATLQPGNVPQIDMLPMRGPFQRGMLSAVYMDFNGDIDEVVKLYEDYYDDHNFTFIVDKNPDLKDVVNTNKCLMRLQRIGSRLLVTSVIDNMLKGGAGTAVHNMNLLFGLHERTGLWLKASAY